MQKRTFLRLCVSSLAAGAAPRSMAAPVDLSGELAKIRAAHGVPSLAAMDFTGGKIISQGATGRRMRDSAVPVTMQDKYHLASCTKSMTATLAAMLVEAGKLKYDSTLGEVLTDVPMHGAVRGITLWQLLTHRSGIVRDIPDALWEDLKKTSEPPLAQRMRLARTMLARPPAHTPGAAYEYSNAGYALAGMMVERRAGMPWEQFIRKRLFSPLGMKSAGFGVPATPGVVDQPWGHHADGVPVTPGPLADNVEAIAPAGLVHASLPDWVKYAQFHLRENGPVKPSILSVASLKALHGSGQPDGYYAGWERHPRDWANGCALYHNGTNTSFYAVIWIAPGADFGVVAATNQGGDKAAAACNAAAGLCVAMHAGR